MPGKGGFEGQLAGTDPLNEACSLNLTARKDCDELMIP